MKKQGKDFTMSIYLRAAFKNSDVFKLRFGFM